MIDAALDVLALAAWSRHDEMRVLADHLLENNLISMPRFGEVLNEKDDALFTLECAVREWIITRLHPTALLRVTAGWPNVFFVAHESIEYMQRIEFVPGVLLQPRLLRDSG